MKLCNLLCVGHEQHSPFSFFFFFKIHLHSKDNRFAQKLDVAIERTLLAFLQERIPHEDGNEK